MKKHIDRNINQLREKIAVTYEDLNAIIDRIQNEELAKITKEITNNISEPFMFVIVGEVKAGKSSFINALLESEKEICKVAPSPMTDTIQQITYGKEQTEIINPYLKKIYQPVEILKEITIVDTPGTNTIVEHHQEITERYIPSSDLIVFVFEAKNPYRQSSWEFFDFIHSEWHKKIIFILQQKDLLNQEDLDVNIKGVKSQAEKKGISNAEVFAVSAKQEQGGDLENSGFLPLRKYLEKNVTGGITPYLKLLSSINSAEQIIKRISSGIQDRKVQWELDKKFREEIRKTLDNQEQKSIKQVHNLIDNLLNAYDKVTLTQVDTLKDGLSIFPMFKRSFTSMFGLNDSVKVWLNGIQNNLEQNLDKHLKDKLQEGVIDIADSIQNMGKMVDLKIRASQTILKDDHEIFSDIAEKRANVLKDLQNTFAKFLNRSENYYDNDLLKNSKITPNLLAGGGIAAVGVIITTITSLSVVDITGGILTATGIIFAGVSLGFRKRKIVSKIKEEIAQGRERIETEIHEKLTTYIAGIKEKIDENFDNFDDLIRKEEIAIKELLEKEQNVKSDLETFKKEIDIQIKRSS